MIRYADQAGTRGLSARLLMQFIRTEFRKQFSYEDLEAEIQYLFDKMYLAPIEKSVSPENSVWRVTATGRDWLATQVFGEAE